MKTKISFIAIRLLFLLILLFTFSEYAAAQDSLIVNKADGSRLNYALSDITSITFSGVTGVEDAQLMQEVLTQFTVRQNYPNPFNPSTNIEYSLPEDGFAEVSIYTINGELIRTLYSGEQSAGTHNLSWNSRNSSGSSVSSGIYLYQVRFNNSVMTKKMLLLK